MTSTIKSNPGRVAGLIYLLLVVIAPYRLIYLPGRLFVTGDATATAQNIATNELLFRLGILGDLCCGVIVLLLTVALYRLFRDVSRYAAAVMVLLGGVLPAAIDFLNTANDGAALLLVRGGDYLSAFDESQRYALAFFFLRLHHQVIVGAEILWGLWLWPLGLLTYRSGFMPRFLGVWLFLNGAAYLVISITGLFMPQQEAKVFNLATPLLLGEMAFMLWLVIRGAVPPPARAAVATPAR